MPEQRDVGSSRPWTSAIRKQALPGPVWLGPTGLPGDQPHDRRHHGGPHRALLAYAADHYPRWLADLGRTELPLGSFGENLAIANLDEAQVCLGDTYRIGQAVVQVSEPRLPCATLARHLGDPSLVREILANGRTGWYLRVLEPGRIQVGDAVALENREYPEWPMARVCRVSANRRDLREEAHALGHLAPTTAYWRSRLLEA